MNEQDSRIYGKRFELPRKQDLLSLLGVKAHDLDYMKVEEIHQNEFGVTQADDAKPILVTYGLLNCVGIAGFSEETGVGFVAHYQHNTKIPLAIGALLYHLSRATGGEDAEFKVRMKGGVQGMSEHLVAQLCSSLTTPLRTDIRFALSEDESAVLQPDIKGVDLGVDTRTGTFIEEYQPLSNPYHREPLPPEYRNLVFASTSPTAHYVTVSSVAGL